MLHFGDGFEAADVKKEFLILSVSTLKGLSLLASLVNFTSTAWTEKL